MSTIRLVQVQVGEYRPDDLFDAGEIPLKRGDLVVFEYDRCTEFGRVVTLDIPRSLLEKNANPRGRILHLVQESDRRQIDNNRLKAREAVNVCIARVNEQKLDMMVLKAEYSFDATKLIFYFNAEGRVDFRNLVKELARVFRVRIELKQIGVRDRAKMVGGYGVCGKKLCCSSHIKDFSQLSIKMAKEQALPLNPSKITGVCGRIKCCMAYEFHVYRELNQGLPKLGARVQCAEGRGKVISLDILKRTVLIDSGEGKLFKVTVPLKEELKRDDTPREEARRDDRPREAGRREEPRREGPRRDEPRREQRAEGRGEGRPQQRPDGQRRDMRRDDRRRDNPPKPADGKADGAK